MGGAAHFLISNGLYRGSVHWRCIGGEYALLSMWELNALRRKRPEHFASVIGADGSTPDDNAGDEGSWAHRRCTDSSYKHYRFDRASCPPRRLGPFCLVPEFSASSELSSVLAGSGVRSSAFHANELRGDIAELCGIDRRELYDMRHGDSRGRAQWAIRSGRVALYYAPTLRVSMQAERPQEPTSMAPVDAPSDWVRVRLVDARDRPLAQRECELKAPGDAWQRHTSDDNGEIFVPNLNQGQCQFRLVDTT